MLSNSTTSALLVCALALGATGCGNSASSTAVSSPPPPIPPPVQQAPKGLVAFGDSICALAGATDAAHAWYSLVFTHTGGTTTQNYCAPGYWILDEPFEMFNNSAYKMADSGNVEAVEDAGINDSLTCHGDATVGGVAEPECDENSGLALATVLAWRGTSNVILASSAKNSGPWAQDATIPVCEATTTPLATESYQITTYGSSAIGVTIRAETGNNSTADVSIDGTDQGSIAATGISGTPVQATSGNGSVFTYFFPVSPGDHQVIVENNSPSNQSASLSICGVVSGNNPAGAGNVAPPKIWAMEVTPTLHNFTRPWQAGINQVKQNTVNKLASWGFNVAWAPIVNTPTPGSFDSDTYIDNQPSATGPGGMACDGSMPLTDQIHPNNCGHAEIASALIIDLSL